MSGVRALMARVQRVEDARKPPKSRLDLMFGSFEVFVEQIRAVIEVGALDEEFPLQHLERWHREGLC